MRKLRVAEVFLETFSFQNQHIIVKDECNQEPLMTIINSVTSDSHLHPNNQPIQEPWKEKFIQILN